ncbi:tetratricopeptide repeat protein [Magnetospira sp. QH-2]|uniref:tetratricopeptide repeat protein n=1 Tax=Magnetospira sp. (strain QH-2) TaxID=1288970 RepID=UPI0003E81B67|nr:tetratricopeptide repeat protein [Magnetospira sp. QH-2]CCQ74440.1 exported protein of unknown function [Magnetospira sp. QH-2]
MARIHTSQAVVILLASLFFTPDGYAGNSEPDDFTCDDILRFQKTDPSKLALDQLLSLGQAYDKGRCVRQDYTQAFEHYSRTVERGSSAAGFRLGYFYLNGLGVERKENQARYWFRSQALSGFFRKDPYSDFLLALAFFGDPVPDMMHEEIKRARAEANGPPDVMMRNFRVGLRKKLSSSISC